MIKLIPSSTKNRLTLTHDKHDVTLVFSAFLIPHAPCLTLKTFTAQALKRILNLTVKHNIFAFATFRIAAVNESENMKMRRPVPANRNVLFPRLFRISVSKRVEYVNAT